ncbi:MAG: hypothetical protein KAX47_13395, partial [Zoogloea sp.]|nr:hypothetical protein [Zoogloea sp.]
GGGVDVDGGAGEVDSGQGKSEEGQDAFHDMVLRLSDIVILLFFYTCLARGSAKIFSTKPQHFEIVFH